MVNYFTCESAIWTGYGEADLFLFHMGSATASILRWLDHTLTSWCSLQVPLRVSIRQPRLYDCWVPEDRKCFASFLRPGPRNWYSVSLLLPATGGQRTESRCMGRRQRLTFWWEECQRIWEPCFQTTTILYETVSSFRISWQHGLLNEQIHSWTKLHSKNFTISVTWTKEVDCRQISHIN